MFSFNLLSEPATNLGVSESPLPLSINPRPCEELSKPIILCLKFSAPSLKICNLKFEFVVTLESKA